MKKIAFFILPAIAAGSLESHAQEYYPRSEREVYRTEFVSYDVRADADKRNRGNSPFYLPLEFKIFFPSEGPQYVAEFDIPFKWLDRDLFLQIEKGFPSVITINGKEAAVISDDRTPTQLDVSDLLRGGRNQLEIRHVNSSEAVLNGGTGTYLTEGLGSAGAPAPDGMTAGVRPPHAPVPHVFIFSQPKLRIEDYRITSEPDPTWDHGILQIELSLSNSYNFPEKITVGYDIYSPQGKLQYYDMKEITLSGQGRDTVRFEELIYGTPGNWWDADNAALFYGMLTVRRGNMMTEYIPYKTGFGTTEVSDGQIYRNGKPIIPAVAEFSLTERIYSKEAADKLRKDIKVLKQSGINILAPACPQPYWFYDVCDEEGIFVYDRININSDPKGGNRDIDGAATNDPSLTGEFTARTRAEYERNKNRTSIIVWSLGGESGNGYNMYKTYQWLKEREPSRAVYYRDAQGEWNSDLN